MIITMSKVVDQGMKEEEVLRDDCSPVQPVDPLEQQDEVRSESMQKPFNPEDIKENEIVCKDCGKVYATVAKLKRHKLNVHKRKQNLKCDWPNCAKTFHSQSILEEHKMTHTGEKPHQCTEPGCGKTFRQKSALGSHKLIHSGEKPHQCPECDKTFASKQSLKQHKMAHTGEKPHQCTEPGCNKTFSRRWLLEVHKFVHSGKKPHKCPECGKTFAVKSNLEVHKVTHSGEKPYRCSAANCGTAYTSPASLWKHKKTQHKGMLQDEVEVEEQVPPAHEEVLAGGGLPAGEVVLVNGDGVVKEEVVEEKDCGTEEDPLGILPK